MPVRTLVPARRERKLSLGRDFFLFFPYLVSVIQTTEGRKDLGNKAQPWKVDAPETLRFARSDR